MQKFIWNGKQPSISQQIMGAPVHNGGIQLLDIKSRNKAIELMSLKKYLQLREERPLWASIPNILIKEDIPKSSNIKKELAINVFCQEWGPYVHVTKVKTAIGSKENATYNKEIQYK